MIIILIKTSIGKDVQEKTPKLIEDAIHQNLSKCSYIIIIAMEFPSDSPQRRVLTLTVRLVTPTFTQKSQVDLFVSQPPSMTLLLSFSRLFPWNNNVDTIHFASFRLICWMLGRIEKVKWAKINIINNVICYSGSVKKGQRE